MSQIAGGARDTSDSSPSSSDIHGGTYSVNNDNGNNGVVREINDKTSITDGEDLGDEVQLYQPNADNELSRQPTFLSRVQTSLSFFNPRLQSQRKKIVTQVAGIYLLMATLCLGIFSIYWGSMVGRFGRLVNLNYLVVIDEVQVDNVQPLIGNSFQELLNDPIVKSWGTWHVFNKTQWDAIRQQNSPEQEIIHQIHEQKYWASIHIKENATLNWINAIQTGNLDYNISNSTINAIYETGRDFQAMNSYITPYIKNLNHFWLGRQRRLVESLNLSNLSTSSIDVVSTPLKFTFYDLVPFTDPVLVAPSQVGLIYMIIVTFFQFNIFAELHKEVAQLGLHKVHYVIYRILSGWLTYLVLSLVFGLVTIACQVDFTVTFGKSGFLVYWMIAFLTMIAVGTVNEIMGLLCIIVYPPLLGFWLLFWVIVNITPTFVPIVLLAKFFRYGYGLPIHNSYEATKPVFFNVTKRQMGRNIGILAAWCVLATIILIPTLGFFGKVMGKRAMLAAKQAKEKEMEKKSSEEVSA